MRPLAGPMYSDSCRGHSAIGSKGEPSIYAAYQWGLITHKTASTKHGRGMGRDVCGEWVNKHLNCQALRVFVCLERTLAIVISGREAITASRDSPGYMAATATPHYYTRRSPRDVNYPGKKRRHVRRACDSQRDVSAALRVPRALVSIPPSPLLIPPNPPPNTSHPPTRDYGVWRGKPGD